MSGHHYDDWETREECRTRLARSAAEDLREKQEQKSQLRSWILDEMKKMSEADLSLLYSIAYDIKDYKTFFKVIHKL